MAKHINVLKRLLGEDKTDETLTALTKATEKLDKAGVTRKQEAGADGGGEGGADTMLSALDSVGATDVAGLVEGILKVIDELGGTEALDTSAGSHAELVAKLIKAVTGSSAPEAETMADDEEDVAMDGMMMKSAVKSLTGYAVRSIEDMGQLAQAQIVLTEAVEGLTSQLKQLSDLPDRIKTIEDLFAAKPRSASKSSTTVVKAAGEGEESLDKIKKEMGESVGEQVAVLGLKVAKRGDATYK